MEVEFTIAPGFQDGWQVFVLEGELDMGNADKLDAALATCTNGFPVVVDLSALTFIESTGLHALLKQRDHGRPSALVRTPASNVARVLDLIDATRQFPSTATWPKPLSTCEERIPLKGVPSSLPNPRL